MVDYDRIVVIVDGRVVEQGEHDELLELDGVYAQMWRQQVGESERPEPTIDVTEALRRVSLFHDLPAVQVAKIAERLHEVRLASGDVVTEGDGCLYLVAKGQARVVPPAARAGAALAELGPGDTFGLAAVLRQETGTELRAEGPVRLLVLDAQDLAYVALVFPTVAARLQASGHRAVPSGGSRLARIQNSPPALGASLRAQQRASVSRARG